jgi:T6SS immunity protein Tdi1, C-terminal
VDLTTTFSTEQYRRALESWRWLDFSGKEPIFASLFGDLFFRSHDGFWHLNTLEGTFTRPWQDAASLRAALDTDDGQDEYLQGVWAMGADRRGLSVGPDEMYIFAVPPVLGGPISVEAVETIDFVVGHTFLGQIHDQVRGLSPGSQIAGLTIDGQKP